MQECERCGIQIFNDVFDCKECGNVVCDDCINGNLDTCLECVE